MGHDFRPAYLKISILKNISKKPFLALTATATPKVKEDIITELGLQDVHVLRNHLQEKTSPTWFLK
jgi:ATP-dependent DNA helicase RecQ